MAIHIAAIVVEIGVSAEKVKAGNGVLRSRQAGKHQHHC
jgi:hypothetical protein